jgi:hypothetical protein
MPTRAPDPSAAVDLAPVVEEWVSAFAEGWRAPAGADAFADHFEPLMHARVRLVQPGLPLLVGMTAFRERFARPLFGLIPDLHGTVERWASHGDTVFIELRLDGTVGRRGLTLHSCDRVTLCDGRATERIAHYDPAPLLKALALAPSTWRRVLRR